MKLLREYIRVLLEAPNQTAIIQMASEKHIRRNPGRARFFYNELAKFMQGLGYTTKIISAYDLPPTGADVALVHSHGFEHNVWGRGTTVIPLGSILHNAVNHPADANAMRSKFVPGQDYIPPPQHWSLTDAMKNEIKSRVGAEQDRYDQDVDKLDSQWSDHKDEVDNWSKLDQQPKQKPDQQSKLDQQKPNNTPPNP